MSRLDRLVVLLETGSTAFIRNTAADQLSDLAKGHPEETLNLLGRVYPFLKSPKWETRIAAARAFGNIVNHSPIWDPNSDDNDNDNDNSNETNEHNDDKSVKQESDGVDVKMEDAEDTIKVKEENDGQEIKGEQEEELKKISDNLSTLVTFKSWNLFEILKSNKKLLATSIDEIDSSITTGPDDEMSLLSKFKRHKNNNPIKMEADSQVEQEAASKSASVKQEPNTQESVSTIDNTNGAKEDSAPSAASNARLKAMQKRRAKVNAKSGLGRSKAIDLSESSISKKIMADPDSIPADSKPQDENPQFDMTSQQGGEKLVMETRVPELSPILNQHSKVAGLVWQFQGVYELLVDDLFDDKWEIRHGACLGLRELIKKHGKSAGKIKTNNRDENLHNNNSTLEDLAVRLCTLFALDRFGDYVSDTVVAPVRELYSCSYI